MEDAILKYAINLGLFPAIATYLIFVIVKDYRKSIDNLCNELSQLRKDVQTEKEDRINQHNDIKNSINELLEINRQTQGYVNNQLNNLLLKLLDVFDDIE